MVIGRYFVIGFLGFYEVEGVFVGFVRGLEEFRVFVLGLVRDGSSGSKGD